ncbi:MAG TPA: RHS repeat-associated core domain-containing protein, partial [Tepidisphaeraceae bacterium]
SNATTGYLSLAQDGQGKTRSVLNLSGVAVQNSDYDAYGNTLLPGQTVTPWQNPDGYSDFESGLTQQLARSVNRATGTWVSQDPMIFRAGEYHDANLHLYVGGSPLLTTDPSGLNGLETLALMSANVALFALRVGVPVARVAGPLLTAVSLYTFARDPLAAQQFIAEGGNPQQLFTSLLKTPGLLARDARSLLVFGRSILNAADEANLAGREVNALRGSINNVSGATFSQAVLRSLGEAEENTILYRGMTRRGGVNVVPDLPVGVSRGLTDIKDVINITNTPQIQGFASVARQQNNLPFNLIISPRTQSISGTVVEAINRSNGNVFQFNDATGAWSTVDLRGFKSGIPWKR